MKYDRRKKYFIALDSKVDEVYGGCPVSCFDKKEADRLLEEYNRDLDIGGIDEDGYKIRPDTYDDFFRVADEDDIEEYGIGQK